MNNNSENRDDELNKLKFIVFKIGQATYGAPLLSVREVLEYQTPKPMPNMVGHFMGVINVRGAIVGVIDLRVKFKVEDASGQKTTMLLCDTQVGPLAAVVDSVEYVVQFNEHDFDHKPPVQSKVKHEYLLGIAKYKNELITLLDLHLSLCEERLKSELSRDHNVA